MTHRFILNETSFFGPGSRAELPGQIARLGGKKILVVTDPGLLKFGVAKQGTDSLEAAEIPCDIFSDV
ncbi:MAG: iron-containing alcohol dehydrogenase, partial [Muribaculaceae bacterium]|nr:iron-containing alcohol dehydrogenase [Muribaculaceae bacterium]